MKKILIRVESYEKSGLGGMETRIKDFISRYDKVYAFSILSNRNLKKFFEKEFIFQNYNNYLGIIKDILTFRNYDIIESNGHRDNLISILNYLIYFLIYKIKKVRLFIVIHGVVGLKGNTGIQKIIYNFLLYIGILISDKIIVVSEETKKYIETEYRKTKNIFNKKVILVLNYINFSNSPKKEIKEIGRGLIVSRIDSRKAKGIEACIKFCNKYNIKLDIYGGGIENERLKKIYREVNFFGEIDNDNIKYNDYDIIFGMGRSLLEGVGKNLIGVLLGYDELICSVSQKNISQIEVSNFSGRGIKNMNEVMIYNNINENLSNKNYKILGEYVRNNYGSDSFNPYW